MAEKTSIAGLEWGETARTLQIAVVYSMFKNSILYHILHIIKEKRGRKDEVSQYISAILPKLACNQ